MRRLGPSAGCLLFVALCCAGCGRVVFKPSPKTVQLSPQEQQSLAATNQRWRQQASRLDRDNQELESLLAQSRQQIQLLRDEVQATRGQLKSTTEQLAEARTSNRSLQQRTDALAASVQRRTNASIRPNNSLVRDLAIAHLPGVRVRPDGDLIRIEIAAEQLFQPGTPNLRPGARTMLQSAASEIARHYARQIVGVEGHTGRDLIRTARYPSNQHLSIAQATAVYDALVRDARMPAEQLFVVGHGSNHPVVSNASPDGQKRNRRIELVIYPETIRPR